MLLYNIYILASVMLFFTVMFLEVFTIKICFFMCFFRCSFRFMLYGVYCHFIYFLIYLLALYVLYVSLGVYKPPPATTTKSSQRVGDVEFVKLHPEVTTSHGHVELDSLLYQCIS